MAVCKEKQHDVCTALAIIKKLATVYSRAGEPGAPQILLKSSFQYGQGTGMMGVVVLPYLEGHRLRSPGMVSVHSPRSHDFSDERTPKVAYK